MTLFDKTPAEHNADIANALGKIDPASEGVQFVRVGKTRFTVRGRNAAAIAENVRTSHKKNPRGAYKNKKEPRDFPRFYEGMSTAAYVLKFQAMNPKMSMLPIDMDRIGTRCAPYHPEGTMEIEELFDAVEAEKITTAPTVAPAAPKKSPKQPWGLTAAIISAALALESATNRLPPEPCRSALIAAGRRGEALVAIDLMEELSYYASIDGTEGANPRVALSLLEKARDAYLLDLMAPLAVATQPEEVPEPVAQATAAAEVSPVDGACHITIKAAIDLERLTNCRHYDATRRDHIKNGRAGRATSLPYIIAEMTRMANMEKYSVGKTEAIKSLAAIAQATAAAELAEVPELVAPATAPAAAPIATRARVNGWGISSLSVGLWSIQYPSGRFGYVGSVPDVLAYVDDSTPEQIEKAKRFGGRFGPAKRTFKTEEEVVSFAAFHGFTCQTTAPQVTPTSIEEVPELCTVGDDAEACAAQPVQANAKPGAPAEPQHPRAAMGAAHTSSPTHAIGSSSSAQSKNECAGLADSFAEIEEGGFFKYSENGRIWTKCKNGAHGGNGHELHRVNGTRAVWACDSSGSRIAIDGTPGMGTAHVSSAAQAMGANSAQPAPQNAPTPAAESLGGGWGGLPIQNGNVKNGGAGGVCPSKIENQAAPQLDRMRQRITGKSGKWSAIFSTTPTGKPGMVYTGRNGAPQTLEFETGAQRMRALQTMARSDDAQPADLKIVLSRGEGPTDECGIDHTVASFAEADALLTVWSASCRGAVSDKCDFWITWPDGNTYTGCYLLRHHSKERPSLAGHMVSMVDFYTGKGCPDHMSAAAYERALSHIDGDTREAYEQVKKYLSKQGIHTGRARPVSVDLRELVAQGLPVADLVGLGVRYCGDACNAAEVGAITDADIDSHGRVNVLVTTESGSVHTPMDADFSDALGTRYRLDFKRHGAPYLAQLAAAVATARAQATAAKETKANAYALEKTALAAEFAHLERTEGNHQGGVFAARNMRTELRRAFPGVKFSVKSDYSRARVNWADGPTEAQVKAVVGRFDIGTSDYQTDYFSTVRTAFSDLFGGVQYMTISRDTSQEFTTQALAEWWPTTQHAGAAPTEQDWCKAEGVFSWGNGDEFLRQSFRRHLNAKTGSTPAKATRKPKA